VFITAALAITPSLEKKIGLTGAIFLAFLVLCAALVFYGIILGPVAQIHILVSFLFGAAILLIPKRKIIIIFSCCLLLMVSFLQFSYYFNWFRPIPMDEHTTTLVSAVVIYTGTFLNVFVVYYFAKNWVNKTIQEAYDSKKQFLREFSHEMRIPMTALKAIAENLEKADPNTPVEELRAMTENLVAASAQCLSLVNNTLELSKSEEGIANRVNNAPIDIQAWLERVVRINQVSAGYKHIQIHVETGAGFPGRISSDEAMLSSILNNLLSNAIKFSPEHSRITVLVSVLAEENQWQLKVTDQGRGMEDPDKYFQNYFTEGRSITTSSGLGLGIMKKLTLELGGTVKVQSAVNQGTTFTLQFPLQPAGSPVDAEPPTQVVQRVGRTALVIDDNPMGLSAFNFLLKDHFNEIVTASNGEQGISVAKDRVPDMIFLDMEMPGMNGHQTLQELKSNSRLRHIPVIIVTGDQEVDKKELVAAGAVTVLLRPVDQTLLREVLKSFPGATMAPRQMVESS
jgi:signal transduction histidine kinase/CheY-like chemotaxis protein